MKRIPLLAVLAVLGGCAISPVVPVAHPRAVWQAHRARLRRLSAFRVRMLAGVRAGTHGGSLMLDWIAHPPIAEVRGYGPLGTLVFRLHLGAHGASLTTRRGHYTATNADTLLARLTGWRLPVEALRYWILGMPAPGTGAVLVLNHQGLLGGLRQDGWTIRYRRYDRTRGVRLPRRLTLVHRARGALPILHIRLWVKRWHTH